MTATRLVLTLLVTMLVAAATDPLPRKHTNATRLSLERLAATHSDVEKLKTLRVADPPRPGMTDFRCILHAHAEDSTHTGGTLAEMIADAKKTGVHAILLSDHYRPPADFMDTRRRGLRDGVLLIPGSEVRGFLAYPMKSILDRMDVSTPDFVATVTADEGMIFLSHIEERKDHSVAGLTGLEVYNRHYDAKRDIVTLLGLVAKLTDPKQLADLEKAVKLYPDEVFAFQCDYPKVYLDKWDAGTKQRRLTGVAANDCHHNQVFVVKVADANTVLVGTTVDPADKWRKLTVDLVPAVAEMTKGRKAGDVVAKVDLDPYAVSFRNVCTHVLAAKLDEPSLRAALKAGRAYVSHDWMGDATGFRFEAVNAKGAVVAGMGDEVKLALGLKLTAHLPLPAYLRLVRHGQEVAAAEGKAAFEYPLTEAGVYRLEAWLQLDGEWRPWVFSNPVYVR